MKRRAHNKDFKWKVIKFIEEGNSVREASELFSLPVTTVGKWWHLYKDEGIIESNKRRGAKSRIDREELIKYIESNSNATLKAIGKEFKVSAVAVYYCLKKLGYSYQSKSLSRWCQEGSKSDTEHGCNKERKAVVV